MSDFLICILDSRRFTQLKDRCVTNVKIALMNKIASPHLDQLITKAIIDCSKYKGHGPKYLHSLLEPITWWHPLEILVGDILSMPKGKWGFTKITLDADVYSQHVWADKLKTAASATTTCKTFNNICTMFTIPEVLMVDRGVSSTIMLSRMHMLHVIWSYEYAQDILPGSMD